MNKFIDIENKLNKEYLKAYNEIHGALNRSIADKYFLNEVLEDLIEMLYRSQEEGRNIEDVLPNGVKGFIDDIEKTYYKGIPKRDVYLGLLGRTFNQIAIFCLMCFLSYGDSKIVLIGIPTGLFYAVLMHFIFGNFKNSYLRTIVDFIVYIMIYAIASKTFIGVAKEELSSTIILLIIMGFGTLGYVISSRKIYF
jgi:DNA-binding ferritin-like protein (Dps family)